MSKVPTMTDAQVWLHFAKAALDGYLSAPIGRRPVDDGGDNFMSAQEASMHTADYMLSKFKARFAADGTPRAPSAGTVAAQAPSPAPRKAPPTDLNGEDPTPFGRGSRARTRGTSGGR